MARAVLRTATVMSPLTVVGSEGMLETTAPCWKNVQMDFSAIETRSAGNAASLVVTVELERAAPVAFCTILTSYVNTRVSTRVAITCPRRLSSKAATHIQSLVPKEAIVIHARSMASLCLPLY